MSRLATLARSWWSYHIGGTYRHWQCKHLSGCNHDTSRYYCQRLKGHFGEHRYE